MTAAAADISVEQQLQTAVQQLTIDPVQGIEVAANEIKAVQGAIEANPRDNKTWDAACVLAEALANAARNESVRTPLGESGIIQSFASLLKTQHCTAEFQRQTLRVLGNACFDHEENRKRVESAGILPIVIKYLDNTENSALVLTTCGFLLNSSMGYEPIQKSIHENGGVQRLTRLLDPARMEKEEEHIINMAVKVLDNVIEDDSSRNAFKLEDVEHIVKFVKYGYDSSPSDDLELLESLTTILLHAVAENDSLEIALVDSHCFQTLLELVERSGSLLEVYTDEEEKQRFKEISRTITKVVVFCTSPDEKMEPLFNDQALVQRFLNWVASSDESLIQCAIYALGNLARSDSHCTQLVQRHSLHKILLNTFQSYENATTQYAVLCCLKHLCLPKNNKAIIGKAGAVTKLAPMLDTSKDMLKRNQFLVIGIIKLLCANEYDNTKQLLTEKAANDVVVLDLVLGFLDRVDDPAAKSEATRVLTNLIKSIWLHPNAGDVKQRLVQPDIILPIAEMVKTSTFIVLKNDGIIALTLVFAEYDESVRAALPKVISLGCDGNKDEQRPFVEVVAEVATSQDNSQVPVEIQCNACVLLESLARAASRAEDAQSREKLKQSCLDKLESVINANSKVSSFAQKAVAALSA